MSCSITDVKLSNIQGISIHPKFEDKIAGREFAIRCVDAKNQTISGLFTMNQLEGCLHDLYKEAKREADSKDKLNYFRYLKEFSRTLADAEDEGIAVYDRMGCFFQLITTLFCRLFDLCSPSHKEYQTKLKTKIEKEFARLKENPAVAGALKSPAIETLIVIRGLECEFTPKATRPVDTEYKGPLITHHAFNGLLNSHDAVIGQISGTHGNGVANLKDAFSNGIQKFDHATKVVQAHKLQCIMTLISQKDQATQEQLLTELASMFASCQDYRNYALNKFLNILISPNLGLEQQLHAIIARTYEKAFEDMIVANHPNCRSHHVPSTEQFIHLRSLYLIQLADILGLEGKAEAFTDVVVKNNHMILPKSAAELATQHRAIFNAQIDPLCREIANLLNDSQADPASMVVTRSKVIDWVNGLVNRGQLPDTFGLYDDNKALFDCYIHTREATGDQQDLIEPYFSPDEIKYMFQAFGYI